MDPPEVGAIAEDCERDSVASGGHAGWVLWVRSAVICSASGLPILTEGRPPIHRRAFLLPSKTNREVVQC